MRISVLKKSPWFASGILVLIWLLSIGTVYFLGDGLVPRFQLFTLMLATTVVLAHAGIFALRVAYPSAVFLGGVLAAVIVRVLPMLQTPEAEAVNYGVMIFAAYALIRHEQRRNFAWVVLLTGSAAIAVVYGLAAYSSDAVLVGELVWSRGTRTIFAVLAAWIEPLIGAVIAVIVRNSQALNTQHRRADVAAERTRIARELHDTTAHHLTGIAIQATAARAVLDRDPEQARASLERISASASEALSEIRFTLGQLHSHEVAPTEPQPRLTDIPQLIAECRALGMAISFEEANRDYQLKRAEEICVYQVLREALTNARRHAPGAPVQVQLADSGLIVRTAGHFTPADDGRGAVGMRERAASVGATFTQGPINSGWELKLEWRAR